MRDFIKKLFRIIIGLTLTVVTVAIVYYSTLQVFRGHWGWGIIFFLGIILGYAAISLLGGRKIKNIAKDVIDILMGWSA